MHHWDFYKFTVKIFPRFYKTNNNLFHSLELFYVHFWNFTNLSLASIIFSFNFFGVLYFLIRNFFCLFLLCFMNALTRTYFAFILSQCQISFLFFFFASFVFLHDWCHINRMQFAWRIRWMCKCLYFHGKSTDTYHSHQTKRKCRWLLP